MALKLTPTTINMQKCISSIGDQFNLVLVAAHRARELRRGYRPLVENNNKTTPVVLALSEIEQGKIGIEYLSKIR